MPQSVAQWLSGHVAHAVDRLAHAVLDDAPPPDHPLFPSHLPPSAAATLRDHVTVITGADTGAGFAAARHLAALGATVILACRNPLSAAAAAESIRRAHAGACVETGMLDLSSYISVRAFADALTGRRVDSLVLNASVVGAPQTDPDTHLVHNHVGHALLALLLLPMLSRAPVARVVSVASVRAAQLSDLRTDDLSFAKRAYGAGTAFANSQLCALLFMRALAARLDGSCVLVNAAHRGSGADAAAHTLVYAAAAPEVTGSGDVFCRTSRVAPPLPAHLVDEAETEAVWDHTLHMAGVTDADMGGLRALEKKAGALRDAVRLRASARTPRGDC